MGKNRIQKNIGLFLYDRQKGGKYFAAFKKSCSEVYKILQSERPKK